MVTPPAASTTPVRNPIDDRCPSPMPRTLITNRRLPAAVAALVWVGHDAGIAQRRPLDGVLAGECRPQQQHSRLRQLAVGIEAIGEFTGVPAERADQIAVTPVEAGDDIVERRAHLVLVEGEDALHHGTRAGFLVLEPFLPGNEEPGDHPRRVGGEPLRAARDEPGPHRSHCGTVDKRRACCMRRDHRQGRLGTLVEVHPVGVQTVISATGLRIPHDLSRVVVALETRPQLHGRPSGQIGPASTAAARAHASASVATSMGC